jgi:hypothetical protein
LALTEGKLVVNHFITEMAPQWIQLIWSLGEDIDIFLEDLAEKHGLDLVEAESHGTVLK